MKLRTTISVFIPALVLVAGFVALPLTLSTSVSASSERNRRLHVTKECSTYAGAPGEFCTITSSNVRAITVGTKIFYDQAAGIPAGLVDSNVVLDAGNGNRAVGRCTLDMTTGLGLCTFSGGTGKFASFDARVDVSPIDRINWRWDGTYSFDSEHDRD